MMLYFANVGIYLDFLDQPEPVFPDENWLTKAIKSEVCPQCMCVNRERYPAPVDVVLEKTPENQTSALIETTKIIIWKKDFIEKLLRYQDDLVLGKCLLSTGEVIDDYASCYTKKFITIRGGKQSRYQICPNCGAVISHVEPGPKYVLEKEINGSCFYQDALSDYMNKDSDVPWDEIESRYFLSGGFLMADEERWQEGRSTLSDVDFIRTKWDLFYGYGRIAQYDPTSNEYWDEIELLTTFWNSGAPRY